MDSKYNTNTENDIRNESQQLMVQELPAIEPINRQERNQSSNTQRPNLHQPSHQYQEMCEIQMDCEDKKATRNIPTSINEDIKPELIQHGNNNNNNEDENDFPIAKRILRSSLIVSTASNESNHTPTSGGGLWMMNVDGQTSTERSDNNTQSTGNSDSEVHNPNLIQQIGGNSFRDHESNQGNTEGLLGSGSQQQPHHLSENLQQSSHHQNVGVDDEGNGPNSVGGRSHNRYLRDYHTLSSAHHHLNNPQSLPPPPTSHHPQDVHTGFEHLSGGGNQESFEDRYQTRPPVDLSYIRNSGGTSQGPYSPQGGQGIPDHWKAPDAAQQLLEQRYFGADAIHNSVSQANQLAWPTAAAEHQGYHHHHHRFAGAMGPQHLLAKVSNMSWGDATNPSNLTMNVGGGGSNSGRPGSSMSGKSKLCSPTGYSGNIGSVGSNPNDFIQDETLAHLTVKELNKRVSNLSRDEVVALKQRRRTLKNRGYAMNCRLRRQQHKETLEIQVTGLHDEMKKMRNEIKKLTNERDYYRSQWEKEKYNNNHHGAHNATANVNNGLSNGSASSGGNLILGGTSISSGSVATSCSIDQPIINAHHAHSHPHMILPHVSSIASSSASSNPANASSGHFHPSSGAQNDQLVDLRLSSSNGNQNNVDDYKRVAYVAAAITSSVNDLKLLR